MPAFHGRRRNRLGRGLLVRGDCRFLRNLVFRPLTLFVSAVLMLAVASAASPAVSASATVASAILLRRLFGKTLHDAPFDLVADQAFDRGEAFFIVLPDQREGMAGAPGAARAADAVHVIVGLERHVEIEDVSDRRKIGRAHV